MRGRLTFLLFFGLFFPSSCNGKNSFTIFDFRSRISKRSQLIQYQTTFMMSQPNVGAAQKAAGKPRRQETGPPQPTGLSRQAAAKKAARLLASTDTFTIGKLSQSFDSMGQNPPGGILPKKGIFLGSLEGKRVLPSPH